MINREKTPRTEIPLLRLVENPEEIVSRDGKGISVYIEIQPSVLFFLTEDVRNRIIELAEESPSKNMQAYCSGTPSSFQPDSSPEWLIGHAIEHRVVNSAAREAVEQGHREVIVKGETVITCQLCEIKVDVSGKCGVSDLKTHLLVAIKEIEGLLRS